MLIDQDGVAVGVDCEEAAGPAVDSSASLTNGTPSAFQTGTGDSRTSVKASSLSALCCPSPLKVSVLLEHAVEEADGGVAVLHGRSQFSDASPPTTAKPNCS